MRGAEVAYRQAADHDKNELQKIVKQLQTIFDEKAEQVEKNTAYAINPIQQLVRSQLASGLTVMNDLKNREQK